MKNKTAMRTLFLIGASGVAHEMIDTAYDINSQTKKWDDIVILDDDHEKVGKAFYRGTTIKGTSRLIDTLDLNSSEFIVTFSTPCNFLRRENYINNLKEKHPGIKFGTLVHPSVYISPEAQIGEGSFIGYGAFIDTLSCIGKHVIILFYTVISRFVEVGDYSFISASVNITGNKKIGKNNYLGVKSTINANVGCGCLIGTAAIVKKDLPDNSIISNPVKNDILTCKSPIKMQMMLSKIV